MSQAGLSGLSGSSVAESLTGNVGGPVFPTGNNINVIGSGIITVTGNPGTSTLTISSSGSVLTFTGNDAVPESPIAGNFNLLGTGSIATVGSAGTETIGLTGLTNHAVLVGAGTATITKLAVGANGAVLIGATGADPAFALLTSSDNSILFTTGANTLSLQVNSSLIGETITGNSGGALSPTAGNWNILGASAAAGTTPVTTAGAVSTLTVKVQTSQAIAATDATKIGLAAFDSADFTVDANGFVSAAGTGFIKTITGNSGGAEVPLANNFNVLGTGSITVAGSANTETVQLTGLTNHAVLVGAGTATITKLAVGADGAVLIGATGADPAFALLTSSDSSITFTPGPNTLSLQVSGSVVGKTITGNSGGALSPTAGNWNILGAAAAAGTTPVTTSGAVSTLTVNVQTSQAIAATDATKIGLAAFDSADFTVDANGFVSAAGTGFIKTITGNSGGAESPLASNFNILGTGSITVAGSANTETVQLTGLTNHAVLVGAGTATITKVGPTATAGQVLQSAGAAADPAFSTATYPTVATSTGTILRADGTNWVNTTSTFADTYAASTLLYSNGANTVTGLATGNNGVLITSATGVPSWLAAGTTGQVLTATTGSPASWASPAASSISITGNSGGALTGNAFTFTGGTTGLTFAGAGTTETLGGTLAIANGGTNATSFTQSNGIVTYNGTRLVNYAGPQIDSSGRQTNTTQPCFAAYVSATVGNVTGNGATYTVLFDTKIGDNDTNYATGTGIFTAPVAGYYLFATNIIMTNVTAAANTCYLILVTTAQTYTFTDTNLGLLANGGGYSSFPPASVVAKMSANDTAKIQIQVNGMAGNTAAVVGNSTIAGACMFSGVLVC